MKFSLVRNISSGRRRFDLFLLVFFTLLTYYCISTLLSCCNGQGQKDRMKILSPSSIRNEVVIGEQVIGNNIKWKLQQLLEAFSFVTWNFDDFHEQSISFFGGQESFHKLMSKVLNDNNSHLKLAVIGGSTSVPHGVRVRCFETISFFEMNDSNEHFIFCLGKRVIPQSFL